MKKNCRWFLPALVWCMLNCFLNAALKPEDVPQFSWRARVVLNEGKIPEGKEFTVSFGMPGVIGKMRGDEWSVWTNFDLGHAKTFASRYPNSYMHSFPLVTHLSFNGISEPAKVNVEVKFLEGNTNVTLLEGNLYGPALGILIYKDEKGSPLVSTMAGYNRRYWKVFETAVVKPDERPKKFPIVDRFISGDNDLIALKEGITALAGAGFSAIMLPPDKRQREQLLSTGNRRTAWAVYNPPGYAFDYDRAITPESIKEWAQKEAKQYIDAGYSREDMAVYAMSDEPGWYFPFMFKALTNNPVALNRFREYVRSQGIKPGDLGVAKWEDVYPLGRSKATDIRTKRLFYWTMRFFSWDSSRHFAVCTRALEEAFYTNMPVLVNWNFFSGRFYVPGPVANNSDKKSPDAAMGGHDWLEFGKMRGCTMLWTEDWFGDGMAPQWSYYCARLRAAARKGGVNFGGYVIPRTAGQREDGILQKIITIIGCEGKAIKYFVFGPEYNFPGNCYSENVRVLPKMAEAHKMIGMAEELLWPGKMPRSPVGLLMPRSSFVWDAKDIPIPHMISDATNVRLNNNTVDYLAEVFDLYTAFQHANIPVDIIDEDDLRADDLRDIKILYVTEPNVPVEGLKELEKWVKNGGVLVTVSGACSADRYDEPLDWMEDKMGIKEKYNGRLLIANLGSVKEFKNGNGQFGTFTAIGQTSEILATNKLVVLGRFDEGQAAVVEKKLKKGKIIHFAWFPGMSYAASAKESKGGLPAGWSDSIREWIIFPVKNERIEFPVAVNKLYVETPVLISEKGAVVTLLNWSGEKIEELKIKARLPFRISSVSSVKQGDIKYMEERDSVVFEIPLDAADFVMLRK